MKHSLVDKSGESVSAVGGKFSQNVIFKGQNLMSSWLPRLLPEGWVFAANTSPWRNHFVAWNGSSICVSDPKIIAITRPISTPPLRRSQRSCFSGLCQFLYSQSHWSYPSPTAFFSSSVTFGRWDFCSLEAFGLTSNLTFHTERCKENPKGRTDRTVIIAREQGITKQNILSGWRGACLFPENMHDNAPHSHTTHRLWRSDHRQNTASRTNDLGSIFHQQFSTQSTTVHAINQAFLIEISRPTSGLHIKLKPSIEQLHGTMSSRALMYNAELDDVKEINGRRKEREVDMCHVLKDKPVASSEAVEKASRGLENKKKERQSQTKRQHKVP